MPNISAYTEAIRIFKKKNPPEMAANAGGSYDESGVIRLKYLNAEIEVNYPSGEIRSDLGLVKNDKVLILQYLTSSCGAAPRNSWISFIQLPDGPHHHGPFVMEAINPLAVKFGENPDEFIKQVHRFGAVETELGDYGVIIPVFNNVPLALCLWQGDEEFPAGANILFDVTAPLHLTTAALWVMGVEISGKIRGIVGQQYSK